MASDEDTTTRTWKGPMEPPSSFAIRRPHSAQLGAFELPPPPLMKYSSTKDSLTSQSLPGPASVGNLLTPPGTRQVDDTASTPGVNAEVPTASSSHWPWPQYQVIPITQQSTFLYSTGPSTTVESFSFPHAQPNPYVVTFKCDQCPQLFNRKHDLKRHKRMHLAVKPFPCNHCAKSFSRKDALKVRHANF
jgi:uncharacterized Zn-finger protein